MAAVTETITLFVCWNGKYAYSNGGEIRSVKLLGKRCREQMFKVNRNLPSNKTQVLGLQENQNPYGLNLPVSVAKTIEVSVYVFHQIQPNNNTIEVHEAVEVELKAPDFKHGENYKLTVCHESNTLSASWEQIESEEQAKARTRQLQEVGDYLSRGYFRDLRQALAYHPHPKQLLNTELEFAKSQLTAAIRKGEGSQLERGDLLLAMLARASYGRKVEVIDETLKGQERKEP